MTGSRYTRSHGTRDHYIFQLFNSYQRYRQKQHAVLAGLHPVGWLETTTTC